MVELVGPWISAGGLATVYSSAVHPVGSRAWDDEGNEYIFLAGLDSTVVGSWVTYDELGVTTLLAANAIGPVAVAMAISVTGKYGWYGVCGKIPAMLAANCGDNALIGYEAAAGNAGDGRGAGDEIYNAISRGSTAGAAALTDCQINHPFVDDANGA